MSTLDDLESFNVSAEPITFGPFTITFPPEKGGPVQLVLHEASEAAHNAYKAVTVKAMRVSARENSDERKASFDGGQEADAVLVSKCLFKVVGGSLQPVDLNFVLGIPRRITKRLYAKVRQMSAMDEDEETIEFLTSRVESDRRKIAAIREHGPMGKSERSTTRATSE